MSLPSGTGIVAGAPSPAVWSAIAARAADPAFGAGLRSLRRDLHRVPEVGLHLPATQALVLAELEGLGLDEVRVGVALSSVVGVLRGARPGPIVLLRADMDALPMVEETGLDFASRNGATHACGHDLHMAGLVGAARLLAAHRDELAGTVVFAFQPGEEGHGGAPLMLEEGLLEIAGGVPDASFAIHVWPTLPRGVFATRPGAVMAGMNHLHATIHGTGGHASSPHHVRDTVPVIAEIVLALQSFVTRRIDVGDPVVLTVTQLAADASAINVIPDRSTLGASIRTLSRRSIEQLAAELPRFIEGIAAAHGCRAEVAFAETYPVTVNSPRQTEVAVAALERRFGADRVTRLDAPLMASEDFAFILEQSPGAFVLLGARPDDLPPDEAEQPHSPRVRFDDAGLHDHALGLASLALEALSDAAAG